MVPLNLWYDLLRNGGITMITMFDVTVCAKHTRSIMTLKTSNTTKFYKQLHSYIKCKDAFSS